MDRKHRQHNSVPLKASLLLTISAFFPALGLAQSTGNAPLLNSSRTISAPQFGSLAPDQVQGIQFVGKAILGTRGSQPKDATVEALRGQLIALSVDLNQATVLSPPSNLTIQGNGAGLQHSPSIANAVDKANSVLRTRMSSLDQARTHILETAHQSQSPEQRARLEVLSNKVTALGQELNNALTANGRARFTKLFALRNRLQIKSGAELAQESHVITMDTTDVSTQDGSALPDTETPTLTSIVRHR